MLPKEDAVLLGYINMKLRDEYQSLDELCYDRGEDRAEIERRLAAFGYVYDERGNRFAPKL